MVYCPICKDACHSSCVFNRRPDGGCLLKSAAVETVALLKKIQKDAAVNVEEENKNEMP